MPTAARIDLLLSTLNATDVGTVDSIRQKLEMVKECGEAEFRMVEGSRQHANSGCDRYRNFLNFSLTSTALPQVYRPCLPQTLPRQRMWRLSTRNG